MAPTSIRSQSPGSTSALAIVIEVVVLAQVPEAMAVATQLPPSPSHSCTDTTALVALATRQWAAVTVMPVVGR